MLWKKIQTVTIGYTHVLVSDQFWSSTSFGHICFKIFVAKEFSFIVTSLEVPVYSGASEQQIF